MAVGEIPGEFLQRVRRDVRDDFGARGDGSTDDSDAFLRAIEWAAGASDLAPRSIFVPPGDFVLDRDNCLHPATAGVDPAYGIHFEGAAQSYSYIRLKRSSGNER